MKIETSSFISLDELRFNLQYQLSTKELVRFAISLSSNLTEEEEFWRLLIEQVKERII